MDLVLWNGWETVKFAPVEDAPMEDAEEIPFLRENLVLKGPFSKDSNVGWKNISEKGSRQDPVVRIWVSCS